MCALPCMLWVPVHYRFWCLQGEYVCTAWCGYPCTADTGVCRVSTSALHSEYQRTADDYTCTCRLSAQGEYRCTMGGAHALQGGKCTADSHSAPRIFLFANTTRYCWEEQIKDCLCVCVCVCVFIYIFFIHI